jgi:hypothetical protein
MAISMGRDYPMTTESRKRVKYPYPHQTDSENNDSKNNLIYGISRRPFGENLGKTTLRVKKHLGDIEFKALET